MTLLQYSVWEKKVTSFQTNFNTAINQQLKSIYQHKSLRVACLGWALTTLLLVWCFRCFRDLILQEKWEEQKTPAPIYNCERGAEPNSSSSYCCCYQNWLCLPLARIHTQTYFFHSLSLFPSLCPPFLTLPHLFLLSFFLFHSLSRAHSLSFFLTHTLHTAWLFNKHISLLLTKAHFSAHLHPLFTLEMITNMLQAGMCARARTHTLEVCLLVSDRQWVRYAEMFSGRSSTGLFICASQIIKPQDACAMSESQCAPKKKKKSDKRKKRRKKSSLEREGGSETDMGERENKRKREGDWDREV